ncbi:hypothetical protein [Candidatus Palauibacter sp.]|uniref:hypothetical protein n=1 Tax=Candidatus Palauibacter sp. TaxID=3101350 RepID=UPI003AF2A648
MTNAQKIRLRLSEVRQRLNEVAGLEGDDFTDEIRGEASTLQAEFADLEARHRAAIIAEGEPEVVDVATDAEARERIELRGKASLGRYLVAAMQGRMVDGPEAELRAAAEIDDGIPLELWDVPQPEETRVDVPTGAPGTVGINLDRIRPQVFAPSVLPMIGVEMPRVESGTYASATITTSLMAGSEAAGGAAEASTAGFTVTSVTPKRISARLGIRIEDIAAVGQANFEAILRENLSLILSDELDDQGLNGAAAGADLTGIFERLTDPAAPGAVVDFDGFAAAHAGGIDGLWANTLKDVAIVCGPATMALAAKTFQSAANYRGEMSAAAYAARETGGFWTNKRMPDSDTFLTVTSVQQAILYRKGRSMMGGAGAMRTAVCPHWNRVSIDDIYSGSASGERYFTMHVLLGDVILVQPDAYAQVAFKIA